jgi:hypothetical protein
MIGAKKLAKTLPARAEKKMETIRHIEEAEDRQIGK